MKTILRSGACLLAALCLCACGATAVIPAGATAETAERNELGLLEARQSSDHTEALLAALTLLPQTGETALWLPEAVRLEVENIDQNPELPNGCEITSAAIVLNYLGFAADKVELAEQYLPKGLYWEVDPNQAFMGNPADELAFYCLPGPVVAAVNAYLETVGGGYKAVDITGAGTEDLYAFVANGLPVLVWTTRAFSDPLYNYSFQLPNGGWPYSNSHCLVLTGYEDNQFYLSDPLETYESVRQQKFMEIFTAMGSRAVVITPKEPTPEPTPDPSAEASSASSSAA